MEKKEAMKILKDFHDKSALFSVRTALDTLFPELKESEDERIRKELLEHCINRIDGKQVCVDASDYRRWADWLSRQTVENIPNVKSDKEISNEIIKFLELPHPQFVGKRNQEDWIAWLEKQGEQPKKVSIWKHWKDGIAGNVDGTPVYLIKDGHTYSINSCLCFECDYIELSELDNLMLEKQGEKTIPEDINEAALQYVDTCAVDGEITHDNVTEPYWNHHSMTNAYKAGWFEKQGEQKPTWNEEDEDILNNIVVELEAVRDDLDKISYPTYNRLINWLKSLKDRYTWKPSDEQMHYLSWIANIKLGDSVVEQEVSKHLNELLEDLRKLREE